MITLVGSSHCFYFSRSGWSWQDQCVLAIRIYPWEGYGKPTLYAPASCGEVTPWMLLDREPSDNDAKLCISKSLWCATWWETWRWQCSHVPATLVLRVARQVTTVCFIDGWYWRHICERKEGLQLLMGSQSIKLLCPGWFRVSWVAGYALT